jgi:hypothetical protein
MGALALIGMVRGMGWKPTLKPPPPVAIDWRKYPVDGSLRVETDVSEEDREPTWRTGVYLGGIGPGTLAVRLDGDANVSECLQRATRLADTLSELGAARLEEGPLDWNTIEEGPLDWNTIEEGTRFWLDEDGQTKDAIFQKAMDVNGALAVRVLVEGEKEPREVLEERLTIAD